MSRSGRNKEPRQASAPVAPLPAVPPSAEALPPRLLALTPIHAGRIYAPGEEIPAAIGAQLTRGLHWRQEP